MAAGGIPSDPCIGFDSIYQADVIALLNEDTQIDNAPANSAFLATRSPLRRSVILRNNFRRGAFAASTTRILPLASAGTEGGICIWMWWPQEPTDIPISGLPLAIGQSRSCLPQNPTGKACVDSDSARMGRLAFAEVCKARVAPSKNTTLQGSGSDPGSGFDLPEINHTQLYH